MAEPRLRRSSVKVGVVLLMSYLAAAAGAAPDRSPFDRSSQHPYGLPNPAAPAELVQFAFLIGRNDCTERRRKPGGDDWVAQERTWDAWYALDGWAIMDSGVSPTGANGNMRIFDPADGLWKVTFFSTPVFGTGLWKGGLQGPDMVLNQPQKAPGSGLDGVSRLTFSDITAQSFEWRGEWLSEDGSVVYPFWTISCRKTAH